MFVQHNYILPGIIKFKMHVISQDMGEFIIASNL